MTKRNIGNEIIKGMEEAVQYIHGKEPRMIIHKVKVPDKIDVRGIRENLKLSRQQFSDYFGFSIRTVQHWEQGNRRPQGPAKILLLLLQREPNTIAGILRYKKRRF
ncbi:MAG: transcriptional regulator [Gammaproteobacteria bacterium RIFCSPHIGHO2_12_FULL_37_34]|nr:MAG: transcriptional regulator [Gammaproteobacteria bacterium RIFCSPHIGHO2_12_FULL_37_34]